MIPTSFDYLVPSSLQEAVALLQTHGEDAKLLAGGHSLLPMMKLRLAQPKVLIDIGRLPGLAYIREDGGAIAVGALTRHRDIEHSDLLRSRLPLLPETAAEIADVQVRNMGTIGGSLAHADPAADLPAACLALEAEMVAVGPNGERRIRAEDFFTGLLTSALAPAEVLREIRFPVPAGQTGSAYMKVANPASQFAVAGVAVHLIVDGGRCREARVGITGVAGTPFRARATEAALRDSPLDDGVIARAAEQATDGVRALSDLYASDEYRLHLARVYARRALVSARDRALS